MGALVAALQVDPRLRAHLAPVQLHAVVPADLPAALARRAQVLRLGQDPLMPVADVARGDHHGIDVQDLLTFPGAIEPGRLDVEPDPALGTVTFDLGDLAAGKDAVLPLAFVWVPDLLDVHVEVELFDELQPDHAVVCRTIGREGALAFLV